MSTNSKQELAKILDRLLPAGGLARTAARHNLIQAFEGWVSPEEMAEIDEEMEARGEVMAKYDAMENRLRTLLAAWEDAARQVEATEPNTAEWFRFSALAVRNALADPVTTDHAAQKLAEMRDLRGISTTEHEEHQP